MTQLALFILLSRVFLCMALASCLTWLAVYTRMGGWSNIVGRNLLEKTSLLTALLLIGLLGSLLRFSQLGLEIIRWTDLVLLALIPPVMLRRLVIFRRVTRVSPAFGNCLSGHPVPPGALFCPQCGVPVTPPPDPGPDHLDQ